MIFFVQYVELKLQKHKHKNAGEPVKQGGAFSCLLIFGASAIPLMPCIPACKAEAEKPGDVGHEKRPSKISAD